MTDTMTTFLADLRAREESERGRQADPSACGTCTSRVGDGQPVEHDECAQRALLLQAPDHPGYEVITDLTEDEVAALPARFHTPVFLDTCTPQVWACAVCWGDGWSSAWPCATAVKYGAQVFTPDHEAERQQKVTAKALEEARAEVARLTAELADTEQTRNHYQRSADHVAAKRDLAEAAVASWERGDISGDAAVLIIKKTLAVGPVKTRTDLAEAVSRG